MGLQSDMSEVTEHAVVCVTLCVCVWCVSVSVCGSWDESGGWLKAMSKMARS